MGSTSRIIEAGLCRPAALAVLAASAFAAGVRADISRPDFSNTAGLNVVQNSTIMGNELRLTGAIGGQVGGAWEDAKQRVSLGFTTTFQFKITNIGGGWDGTLSGGGDGFAFVIQNSGNLGPEFAGALTGGGLGFNGMSNALAIEFDTWKNDRAQDLDANHISILTNGTEVLTPEQIYSIGYTSAIPDMSDGNVHTVKIDYVPGLMKVYLDNMVTPAVTGAVNLGSKLNLDAGKAWVGFTAATGGAWENHDIMSWSMTTVPSPGSAVLMAAGAVTAGLRRRR